MKIAIIGSGAMGGALTRGMLRCGVAKPDELTITARTQATLDTFADTGVGRTTDNKAAAAGADIVVIAVKPWLVEQVVKEIQPTAAQTLVVLAAGVDARQLREWTEDLPRIATVIPNIAIAMGQSMSFVAPVNTDGAQTEAIAAMFRKMGDAVVTDAQHLAAGTALASCGIAYAMRYVRAATEGGVEIGFRAADAQRIVLQTMAGAVALLQSSGMHPEAAIDQVTTAGGMTIRGLNAMEAGGFTTSVIAGLKGCL